MYKKCLCYKEISIFLLRLVDFEATALFALLKNKFYLLRSLGSARMAMFFSRHCAEIMTIVVQNRNTPFQ